MRHSLLALFCLGTFALDASAEPIVMELSFPGGFDLSVDGGGFAPSGPLTFTLATDNTTPDLDPDPDRGRFALTSVTLNAPNLGITNEAVVSPSPLFLDTFFGGLTLIGAGFIPDIGWNGGPAPDTFMSDINDLSTLPLPTLISPTNSTFFLETITLASGTTLTGTTGLNGPAGTFSAAAPGDVVPEPASIAVFGLMGLGGAIHARRRKGRAAA